MTSSAWAAVKERLEATLADLHDHGVLIVAESAPPRPAPSHPNYHRTMLLDEAAQAAHLGVGALAALGLSPDGLTWERF